VGEEFTVFGQTAKLSPEIYAPLTVYWQCHSLRMHEDCRTRAIVTGFVGRVLTQLLSRQQPHFCQYSRIQQRAQQTGWQPCTWPQLTELEINGFK